MLTHVESIGCRNEEDAHNATNEQQKFPQPESKQKPWNTALNVYTTVELIAHLKRFFINLYQHDLDVASIGNINAKKFIAGFLGYHFIRGFE